MDKLKYEFPVADGTYQVEMYFTEPWYGIGGGMDCTGWRLFDVAINNKIVIKDLDVWKQAGVNTAYKRTITAQVTGGKLVISFPNVAAGEAIISAIAISTANQKAVAAPASKGIIQNLQAPKGWSAKTWLDLGDQAYVNAADKTISQLPSPLFGAEWIQTGPATVPIQFTAGDNGSVYVGMNAAVDKRPSWLKGYEVTGLNMQLNEQVLPLYRKLFKKGEMLVLGENAGNVMYTVAVLPAVTLEPATDLRKTVTYRADNAEIKGSGAVADTLSGRKVVRFTQPSGSSVAIAITPGVADLYALRIKYYNFTDKPLTGKMQLLAADGTVMKEETLTFKTVVKGKSGTIVTTTGTSINAGNYKVVITATDAEGLSLSGIEMQ